MQPQNLTSEKTDKNINPVSQSTNNPETMPIQAPERQIEVLSPKEMKEPSEKMEIKKEGFLDDTIEDLKKTLKKTKKRPSQIPQVRDETTLKVENIMQQGLEDAYKEMTAVQQQEFKIKGEKTALEIRNLLNGGKVKLKKIINLIFEWLRLLPGVNKFFLEQEAKIKADKIIALNKIRDNSKL